VGDLRLSADPNAVCHLVCCRAEDWTVGFCGARSDEINYVGPTCPDCRAAALEMDPELYRRSPPVCPVDHEPCPSGHEVDTRVAETTVPVRPD
jgi:hypothetical protein